MKTFNTLTIPLASFICLISTETSEASRLPSAPEFQVVTTEPETGSGFGSGMMSHLMTTPVTPWVSVDVHALVPELAGIPDAEEPALCLSHDDMEWLVSEKVLSLEECGKSYRIATICRAIFGKKWVSVKSPDDHYEYYESYN